MRVIAGRYRGIPLKTINSNNTRPTTDKIKETMFNMLTGYIEGDVLDLFAGSGSLGIEALSRGAEHCIFVEQHPKVVKIIQENIDKCRIDHNNYQLVKANANNSLDTFITNDKKFDMIFLDPPYNTKLLQQSLQKISDHDLLLPNGLIICEMDKNENYDYHLFGYKVFKSRLCGITKIEILIKDEDDL